MKRSFYIGISCVIVILSSCDKEITSSQKDSIVVGEYTNMIRESYDTILKLNQSTGYLYKYEFSIDLNNDNMNDFKLNITAESWDPTIRVLCLNSNSMLLGQLAIDTTFKHLDENEEYYSCSRINEDYFIVEISPDVFKITPKKENDTIKYSSYFETDTAFLLHGDQIVSNGSGGPWEFIYNECDNLPMNVDLYIGIKVINNETARLGWIKLVLMDNDLIILTETAIQE